MDTKPTIVHVTHEAIGKIGGIGAVLEGLFTSPAYLEQTGRSILISPLFSTEGDVPNRLGPDGEVLYSSLDGLISTSYFSSFRNIENKFNVHIVYGRRTFVNPLTGVKSSPEVILVDISRMEQKPLNEFKGAMFREFGIRSNIYEHLWEYEQYVRLALPAIAAVKAIGAAERDIPTIIISHEFMGMPTALAAKLDPFDFKTIFYAHEVAPMRHIVEKHPGHDTMFYNVLQHAHEEGLYVNEVFGDQTHFFKYTLVDAARYCDNILAVGDCVIDELRFLEPEFEHINIDIAYNGIPFYKIDLEQKKNSRQKLLQYCCNILGWQPDFIFTHVARHVVSKGLWRDLRVLEHMDKEFTAQGKTAVLIVLSTEIGKRRSRDILDMEAKYQWPVAHREGMPDLSDGEAIFYVGVQEFNAKSRNIKVVYINQFGFCRDCCGVRMPADTGFMDLRKGSDVEFGQSIYEPFGIAQFEILSFGGLCVVSNVCGCAGFVMDITGGREVKNIIIADYTNINGDSLHAMEELRNIDKQYRDRIEHRISREIALEICARLPKNDAEIEGMIQSGYELATHMSWEQVVKNYILRGFRKVLVKSKNQPMSMVV